MIITHLKGRDRLLASAREAISRQSGPFSFIANKLYSYLLLNGQFNASEYLSPARHVIRYKQQHWGVILRHFSVNKIQKLE